MKRGEIHTTKLNCSIYYYFLGDDVVYDHIRNIMCFIIHLLLPFELKLSILLFKRYSIKFQAYSVHVKNSIFVKLEWLQLRVDDTIYFLIRPDYI